MPITINCDNINFLSMIVSIFIGVAATWVFALIYYKKAGDELKQEAQRLRQRADLTIYCLTNPGAKVEAIRDGNGEVTGLKVLISGEASGKATVVGKISAKV
jgi:hypothetical protein